MTIKGPKRKKIVDIDVEALRAMLVRTEGSLGADDHKLVSQLVDTLVEITRLLRARNTTITRLRKLFDLKASEKLADVLSKEKPTGTVEDSESKPDAPTSPPGTQAAEPKQKLVGHGRIPNSAYPDAIRHTVPHESFAHGDRCPCGRGNLRDMDEPSTILRIKGQPPLVAEAWDCGRLRCNCCGKVFTAKPPAEAQGPKYDETAVSNMANNHYGQGQPWERQEQSQADLETPVPASTQWDVLRENAPSCQPVFDELVKRAADSPLIHGDDSNTPILQFMGKRRATLVKKGELKDPERTGMFTTAFVALTADAKDIALFFTGRAHQGENLAAVLKERDEKLPSPTHMNDALARNAPIGFDVDLANCLAHARRGFVGEIENHPTECEIVLVAFSMIFANERAAIDLKMSPEARLRFHRQESAPVLIRLRKWIAWQFRARLVEPTSELAKCMRYIVNHWKGLTLFLRKEGAPLTNNICERALKMAIRYRNNSYFYRTLKGAKVGDIYMTLIFTAKLNEVNPFQYLIQLLRNAQAAAESPGDWLPWTYRATLERITSKGIKKAA